MRIRSLLPLQNRTGFLAAAPALLQVCAPPVTLADQMPEDGAALTAVGWYGEREIWDPSVSFPLEKTCTVDC